MDPNFKMPQVWRSNVNAEFQLPYGFMLSVGAMYTLSLIHILLALCSSTVLPALVVGISVDRHVHIPVLVEHIVGKLA